MTFAKAKKIEPLFHYILKIFYIFALWHIRLQNDLKNATRF